MIWLLAVFTVASAASIVSTVKLYRSTRRYAKETQLFAATVAAENAERNKIFDSLIAESETQEREAAEILGRLPHPEAWLKANPDDLP